MEQVEQRLDDGADVGVTGPVITRAPPAHSSGSSGSSSSSKDKGVGDRSCLTSLI
jgi:hypothetical protein